MNQITNKLTVISSFRFSKWKQEPKTNAKQPECQITVILYPPVFYELSRLQKIQKEIYF